MYSFSLPPELFTHQGTQIKETMGNYSVNNTQTFCSQMDNNPVMINIYDNNLKIWVVSELRYKSVEIELNL